MDIFQRGKQIHVSYPSSLDPIDTFSFMSIENGVKIAFILPGTREALRSIIILGFPAGCVLKGASEWVTHVHLFK